MARKHLVTEDGAREVVGAISIMDVDMGMRGNVKLNVKPLRLWGQWQKMNNKVNIIMSA